MSLVYKGAVLDSELSKNARGGTEMMRTRLLEYVNRNLLEQVAIHFSRPREMPNDVPNILYCHDLAEDPENKILNNGGHEKFDHFVFVTTWQRDQYMSRFGIPYSKCTVIYNAVEKKAPKFSKQQENIKFIYHTTPHRGLSLLVPIFEELCKSYNNIELDVYSSFEVYGWGSRDEHYRDLFERIKQHPKMRYHGAVSNEEVLKALDESHIFLYPNTWKETSCIALIEAIRSKVICIHPNYGALTETAQGATMMYDYTENNLAHCSTAYMVTSHVLSILHANPNFFNEYTSSDSFRMARNDISSYKVKWDTLLTNILNK